LPRPVDVMGRGLIERFDTLRGLATMKIRADIRRGYLARPLLMSLFVLGFSVAFFYDGYVRYPRQHAMFTTYQQIRAEHTSPDGRYDIEAVDADWEAAALAHDWPVAFGGDAPGQSRGGWDIPIQRLLGFVLLPLGVVMAVGFVRHVGRWVEADDAGLTASWGPKIAWDQITRLDKTRWKSKGIAYVYYRSDAGEKRLKLDDWEYEREPMTRIEQHVEQHIDPSLIVGEKPAAEPAAETDAASDSTSSP
jgi:hypothetical protein